MASTKNATPPETIKSVLEALGAVSKSASPIAVKLAQIADITDTSIDPQTDALLSLVHAKAMMDFKALADPVSAASGLTKPTATNLASSGVA